MKKFNVFSLLLIGSIGFLTFQGCTDLDPNEKDSTNVTAGGGGSNATDLLVSAYKDLDTYSGQEHTYALTEHCTDEMMGPTRGTDWGDNGLWRSLHAHTWDATHNFVLTSWNILNSRIYKSNQILAAVPAPTASEAAQAKFLRAFNMFHVMDLYGKVPFRNTTDGVDVNPRVYTRAEAFDFVVKDLTEALPDLPTVGPTAANTTASKAAANALLARVYLNKAVYTGSADNADWDKAIAYCDAVTADGFTIEPNYFDNFQPGADNEIILTSLQGSGQNRIHMTLHYDQKPGGWNGFVTLSEFYDKFEDTDQRKGKAAAKDGTPFSGLGYGFLTGVQKTDDNAVIKNSRNQKDLDYTRDCRINGAGTGDGIRTIKYHPYGVDNNSPQYPKYILLRYGDVVTMKAEAHLRKGDNAGALGVVNGLRAARGASALPSLDLDKMLDERGREMYWEGVRRTDLIRHGKFANTWQEKTVTDAFRALYPIPQAALDSNPNLAQNDGY